MTLVEAVASITVLAVALPPVIGLFNQVALDAPDDILQRAALASADALMEEIVSKDYEDPDLSSGSFGAEESDRLLFDDIDDFDGLVESPPFHLDGVPLAGQADLTRRVTVSNVLPSSPNQSVPEPDGSTNLKRIEVSLIWSSGRGGELSVTTLRSLLAGSPDQSGPLDGPGTVGTVVSYTSDSFELFLLNTTSEQLRISTFEIQADRAMPDLEALRFARDPGRFWWMWWGRTGLPTGPLAPNVGWSNSGIIDASYAANIEFNFRGNVTPGPITFTVTLQFTNGTSSTLVAPMVWPS